MTCVSRYFTGVLLLFGTASHLLMAVESSTTNWLQSSGKDLRIELRGVVVDAEGRPAEDFAVTGALNTNGLTSPLSVDVAGSRFQVGIPANSFPWYSMWLRAASPDGRVAYVKLGAYQVRQAAMDGVKLVLRRPTRQVVVQVLSEGTPEPHAHVQAEIGYGIKLDATTNSSGIASFGLLADQELTHLSAWTDDYRIGGYSFDRNPTRDPKLDRHVVELSECRDQKIRFVDEKGRPAPGIDFGFYVATPQPDINYVITNELTRLKTDSKGEVTYKWLPDWKAHHYYPELHPGPWVLHDDEPRMIENAIVYTVRPARPRMEAKGHVVAPEGSAGAFFVTLRSFEGEREHFSDVVTAFTNPDGTFAVIVLPGATYCAYVTDSQWAGEIIDVLPVSGESEEATPIELSVSKGKKVEVTVTRGPEKKPYPHLSISIQKEHTYRWLEDGEERTGTGGPQWWVTTDERGRAVAHVLPGKLRMSVYTPIWRTEENVEVGAGGEVTRVAIHREFESKRGVKGGLVLAGEGIGSLKGAQVEIGSVDGQYDERESIMCDDDGSFRFETMASEIGLYAETRDGEAAGILVTEGLDEVIEVTLHPTQEFFGFAMGKDEQPLANHDVYGEIRVEGSNMSDEGFPSSFVAKRLSARTDDTGTYLLRGVPRNAKVSVYAEPADGSDDPIFLETIELRGEN